MTSFRLHRCQHCGDQYDYQASGHGCLGADNDATLCPSCKRVVNAALAAVPRKFEQRWRPIAELGDHFKDVTINRCLAWERAERVDATTEGRVYVQRIWPALVNLQTGLHQSIRLVRGRDEFKDWSFRVSTWDVTITNGQYRHPDFAIEVEWEWDVTKGEWTSSRWR